MLGDFDPQQLLCVWHEAPHCMLLQVWDLKTGQLLRIQTVHRGMVTCLAYATSAKLLFSGSIDGSIGVWTDKGNLLQVRVPVTGLCLEQCAS